jgi:hypothetical protein
MTEGKLECSCAEQMELAALFSVDLIGPLANSLDTLAMHRNAGTELATSGSFACTQGIYRELSQSWNTESTRPGSIC